ncbi:MAG: UvrB/UvrC motif-containing protein [Candidatus Pacebacteria bacterium]|nr:UvrB/UvrC motif-containing protein [Candidatus Paceibacterota bacterium]
MPLKAEKVKYVKPRDHDRLPRAAGVYLFKQGKDFLYIGKAIDIRERVKNHFSQPTFKDNIFIPRTDKIGYIPTGSEIEALILEAELIKKHRPKYNTQWKDGKNYFFAVITKEDYPRVLVTHQPAENKSFQSRETIGPFVDSKALKQTLRILRRVFPFRTCKTLPKKPCLYKQLGLCQAPCLGRTDKKEYAKNIRNLAKILRGKKPQVLNNLKKEMTLASKSQNFETAKTLRDKIFALESVFEHSHILGNQEETKRTELFHRRNSFRHLQDVLGLGDEIKRVEGYDVSNIQGQHATGSMVVFEKGLSAKNEYRKFRIKIAGKPDDTAMLKETLARRLKHKEWPMPQVMLIDGGKGQLNVAVEAVREEAPSANLKIVSLAKRNNELFIEAEDKPLLLKNLPQETANLILRIRDEAHRFAIAYHKKLRNKKLLQG